MGRHCILGEEPKLHIKGLWLWRGLGIPFEMKDHPQFENYTAKKLDHNKDGDRKLVELYWTGKDIETVIEGLKLRESKYLK